MKKPADWEKVTAAHYGDRREEPTPGAYVCRIINAYEAKSQAGRPMLKLDIDIAEGEYAGYYADDLTNRKERGWEAYWKLTINQVTDGTSTRFFKGLIEDIERSNEGFRFDFNEAKLVGKLIGVMLDGEEYKSQNGFKGVKLKAGRTFTVREVRAGVKLEPKVRTLDGAEVHSTPEGGIEHVDDADIPF